MNEPTKAPIVPLHQAPAKAEPEIREQHYLNDRGQRVPIKVKILAGGHKRAKGPKINPQK